jgi:hypothetical protein
MIGELGVIPYSSVSVVEVVFVNATNGSGYELVDSFVAALC